MRTSRNRTIPQHLSGLAAQPKRVSLGSASRVAGAVTLALAISAVQGAQAESKKAIPAPYEIQVPDFKTYTFESADDLSDFKAGDEGKISLEKDVYKSGQSSVKWTWSHAGDALVYKNSEAFKNLTGEDPDPIVYKWITATQLSSLTLWVYNEHPVKEALWFEIGSSSDQGMKVDTRFWMSLDFKGWRQLNAMYGRDMAGFPNQKSADTLRIIAPKSLPKGSLIFDDFSPRRELDVRFVRGSEVVPWVLRKDFQVDKISPAEYFAKFDEYNKTVSPEKVKIQVPKKLSPEVIAQLAQLQKNYLSRLGERPKAAVVSEKTMENLRKAAKKRGLTRSANGHSVNGTVGHPGHFWGEASRVATAFLQSKDPAQREELRKLFMNYADLTIQQGHGAGYGLRTAFVRPMWLMKDELKKAGDWRPLLDKMRKIIGVNGELDKAHPSLNADYANTELHAAMFTLFLEDDYRVLYKDLKSLQHWLETVARNGEMKPDGSLFHHHQYYSGYNVPATPPLVDVISLLDGSVFAAPTMHLYLRRVAYSFHLLSASFDLPRTFSGRHASAGATLGWGFSDIYKKLAYLKNPEKRAYFSRVPEYHPSPLKGAPERFDRTMAEIYLSFADHYKKENETTQAFRKMGLTAHDDNGNLTINYAVAMVQKRQDWTVFVRGQRYPFMTGENYIGATSDPNRYMNFGMMEIFSNGSPVNMKDSSWVNNHSANAGWNFNFFPGTTCRELPAQSLRSHFIIDERMTNEDFAVGTSLAGNGVFAMKLKEDYPGYEFPVRIGPVRYWLGDKEYMKLIKDARFDLTFRAKKSYFAFGNRVVCLGSDISSEDKSARSVTTLFQHTLTDEQKAKLKFPVSQKMSTKQQSVSLLDKNGTGYYVPQGNDLIEFQREFKKNPYPKKWNPTKPESHNEMYTNEGNTEVAYFDHGKAANGKGYEYCVVVRSSQKEMDAFASKMSQPKTAYYKVLQKDEKAHVVQDIPSATTAYALFEGGEVNQGALVSVDHPCVMMIKTEKDGHLSLSLSDPRISGDHSDLDFTEVTVVVRGKWKTDSSEVTKQQVEGGNTVLTVRLKDLMRAEWSLAKL